MPGEFVSDDGKVKVELEDIGEGLSGDFDPDDPDDEPLLRFGVYRRYEKGEEIKPSFTDDHQDGGPAPEADWYAVSDASYCTHLRADLPQEVQDKAGKLILARVESDVRNQKRIKRLCQELSWLSADDLSD